MVKEYTCIICPNGCDMEAEIEEGRIITLSGASCKRGREYVEQELTAPVRNIATSVLVVNGELPLASVRLTNPIPKKMIFEAMDQIKKLTVQAPVEAGTVLLPHILGTDSHVIVTKSVKRKEKTDQ